MISIQQHRSLQEHIRNAEDPSIAFRVGGLDVLTAMDKVRAQDEDSEGSGLSDLSAVAEETDEFGRRLLQHHRDTQRLNNAVHSSQRAFKKARPTPRIADRFGGDATHNGEVNGQSPERAGSAGSNGSDPPLNVPVQWGRKAKRQPDWLRKLQGPAVDEVPLANDDRRADSQRLEDDIIIPHRATYTGDEPLQSGEDTPPSMRRRRIVSSPSSMRHMNTTIGPALDLDDQDFSSASLLASTPAVNRRDRKIDELTRREMETLERRGVTTRTLEQHHESLMPDAMNLRPSSAPTGDAVRAPRQRRSLITNKENFPPNGVANVTYKSVEAVSVVSRTAQAIAFNSAQRPAHERSDSHDLLKRLARVTSMSPSSVKDAAERGIIATRPSSAPAIDIGPLSAKSANSDYVTGEKPFRKNSEHGLPAYPTPDPEEQTDPEEELEHLLHRGSKIPDIDVTPAPQETPRNAKTPIVTGAWVDTPAPPIDLRPLLKSTDSTIVRAFGSPSGAASLEIRENPLEGHARRIQSEPFHAKSALADILKEARSATDPPFSDATIQSLEDIVDPDLDLTDPTMTVNITEVVEEVVESIDDDQLLTQAQKDRRQEDLAIIAMNKHLRAARTSIKDADRGLRRVENRIETAQAAPSFTNVTSTTTATHTSSAQSANGKSGMSVCDACGGKNYGSAWKALWTEFRSCFCTWDPVSGWRLTWLGLICASSLGWYLLESTLCAYFCHRLYGSSMVGYGVDPNAPRFPLVIPTLLLRPLEPIWGPAWDTGTWTFGVLSNAMFGENAASSDPPVVQPVSGTTIRKAFTANTASQSWMRTATTSVVAASARVAGSVVDTLDEFSMWDDELLV